MDNRFFDRTRNGVLLLLAVALLPRAIMLARTVAPARDSFRYLAAAQEFEDRAFLDAVRTIDVHPLYPWTYLGARNLHRAITGSDGPYAWLAAGHLWSVVCYLVFLVLAYGAGRMLWNRSSAALGCIAIAIIPRQVCYSCDILSDNLHAALWMAGFVAMLRALERPAAWRFALAGLFAGLAYWTRIEAVLLPMTFTATLAARQVIRAWRLPMRSIVSGTVAYGVVVAIFVGFYVEMTGRLSPRNSANALLGMQTRAEAHVTLDSPLTEMAGARLPPAEVDERNANAPFQPLAEPANLIPRPYFGQEGYFRTTVGPAVGRLLHEFSQETRVWLILLALVALIAPRTTSHAIPPAALPVLFAFLGCCAMLILLQMKAGYMAGRYMTPVLPFVGMLAMQGCGTLLAWVRRLPRLPWEQRWTTEQFVRRRTITATAAIGLLAVELCVPAWFTPLHRFRHGHMQAALWLAEKTRAGDIVYDPTCFSSFFADRPRWQPAGRLPEQIPARFAVIDPKSVYRTDNLNHEAIARINQAGRLIAKFPRAEGSDEVGIYLFELPAASALRATAN